eukprot:15446623-Alexandrium_andersonii.AAC.1
MALRMESGMAMGERCGSRGHTAWHTRSVGDAIGAHLEVAPLGANGEAAGLAALQMCSRSELASQLDGGLDGVECCNIFLGACISGIHKYERNNRFELALR